MWLEMVNKIGYTIQKMNLLKGEDMILNDLLLASQYFGKLYSIGKYEIQP